MDRAEAIRRRGQAGEAIACAYLVLRGYDIVERNVRRSRAEIDVLARRGSLWVAVEVKWRRAGDLGTGEECWRPAQRRRASAALLELRGEVDPDGRADWRFDLITLSEGPGGFTLTHHRAAWSPRGSFW